MYFMFAKYLAVFYITEHSLIPVKVAIANHIITHVN